ncbi:hypothetical protein [Treponema phagedenis]|uniref:Uncharacterized protein n=2 Tax=Treponema phagedenis TaxID=162 RepID=A0A0B7GZM7_TREPH|nr:hypothetical protein [Treponema phagedenis]QEJ96160.1 hypothetical protein FUT79_13765 [Treponema phagedenis]QEK02129.1 hypothetical protein FUT84_13820 [Treponema phagedenis]QEK07396.1 hypothetical protein FUT80_12140 [Treponema phagedenis]QSH95261.1 hypothetical protein C5O78_09535 [Treponema phagedenis]CEM62440.1 hypothetical protein TPHV1_340009 [Treponema phagedenis]
MEKVVRWYSGKLDVVYLYSNKNVTPASKQYKDIETLLKQANIELIPITNEEILDQVIMCPVIAEKFFNRHSLNKKWFDDQLKISLDSLGQRYSKFNVDTAIKTKLNYFVKNQSTIEKINFRKNEVVEEIQQRWQYQYLQGSLLTKICKEITSIEDINFYTISDCLQWSEKIKKIFEKDIADLNEQITAKKQKLNETTLENHDRNNLKNDIDQLTEIINIPSLLEFDEEADVLQKKVLIINGKAGTGKSQLFATTANLINSTGGSALLLLGHKFINNLSIQEQILSTIGLDISFDSFLQILECIGYENDCCVTIFIDAINESSYKEIWQTGLITIINKINKFDHIRLAVSVRSDYEPLVFDDSIKTKIKNKELLQMTHMGFQDDSFNAIKSFLDHYSIPFSPLCFLSYEMTNPLFLTLFCRVYEDGEFNIYGLFDKLIESVDKEVQKAINSMAQFLF